MKKRVVMLSFFFLFFFDVSASEKKDKKNYSPLFDNIDINGSDSRLSTEIVVRECALSAQDLVSACQRAEHWEDVVENYLICSHALVEYLWLAEARHQAIDMHILKEFEGFEQYPELFTACVEELVKEIWQRQKNGKGTNILLDIQQKMRQEKSGKHYELQGVLSQVVTECGHYKKNYCPYLVRNTVLTALSLGIFSGICYFGWALYHCSL